MESKLRRSTDENVDLKREADGLRDEIRSLKGPGPVTFGGGGTSGPAGGRGTGSGPDSLNGGGGDSAIGGDAVDERRMRELEENIRMKNRQIHQLIDDIEEVLVQYSTKWCVTFAHCAYLLFLANRSKKTARCTKTR